MMKALVIIAGLLIGIFAGATVLLFNPITFMQGAPAGLSGAIRSFEWQSGAGHQGMVLTPAGLLGFGSDTSGAPFRDPGIRYARAEVVSLDDEGEGTPALAVRLSALARSNSLLQARLGMATTWNVVWPGRGSVLLAGSENLWTPVRDGLWSALRGRGFHPGRARYPLPPVPGFGPSLLIAGSGEFAAASGSFREEFAPVDDAPGDLVGLRRLHLAIE